MENVVAFLSDYSARKCFVTCVVFLDFENFLLIVIENMVSIFVNIAFRENMEPLQKDCILFKILLQSNIHKYIT